MNHERTMISKRVSRLTVKGMFLMTIAVGITSSSLGVPGARGTCMCCNGGEPPEEMSELVGGDIERESFKLVWFSSHCYESEKDEDQYA